MPDSMYQPTTPEVSARRKALAPEIHEAFEGFSSAVFAEGALPEKTKQLIAVAVAHVTQCPFCITGHTKLAGRKGASDHRDVVCGLNLRLVEGIIAGCDHPQAHAELSPRPERCCVVLRGAVSPPAHTPPTQAPSSEHEVQ